MKKQSAMYTYGDEEKNDMRLEVLLIGCACRSRLMVVAPDLSGVLTMY